MVTDQVLDVGFRNFSLGSYTMNLERRGSRGDLGVKPRGGSSYQINRHRDVRVLTLKGVNVALHAFDQFLVRRSQLRSVGIGGVIADGGGTTVEVARPRE